MSTFIKTYITDAPWLNIILFSPFFGLFMVFLRSRSDGNYYGGSWYSELATWSVTGVLAGYSSWRAEGALERKNARWKAKRKK